MRFFSGLRKLDPKESELELVRKPPKVSRGCGGGAPAAVQQGGLGKRIAAEGVQKVVRQLIGNRRIAHLQEFRFRRPKMTLSETKNGPLRDKKTKSSGFVTTPKLRVRDEEEIG